jgi:hypothetical protein
LGSTDMFVFSKPKPKTKTAPQAAARIIMPMRLLS